MSTIVNIKALKDTQAPVFPNDDINNIPPDLLLNILMIHPDIEIKNQKFKIRDEVKKQLDEAHLNYNTAEKFLNLYYYKDIEGMAGKAYFVERYQDGKLKERQLHLTDDFLEGDGVRLSNVLQYSYGLSLANISIAAQEDKIQALRRSQEQLNLNQFKLIPNGEQMDEGLKRKQLNDTLRNARAKGYDFHIPIILSSIAVFDSMLQDRFNLKENYKKISQKLNKRKSLSSKGFDDEVDDLAELNEHERKIMKKYDEERLSYIKKSIHNQLDKLTMPVDDKQMALNNLEKGRYDDNLANMVSPTASMGMILNDLYQSGEEIDKMANVLYEYEKMKNDLNVKLSQKNNTKLTFNQDEN